MTKNKSKNIVQINNRYKILDKFIYPVLIALIITLIGNNLTKAYKESEILVAQVELVKEFMDRFESDNEYSKEASILAINALGNAKLAINLASSFQTSGTISALAKIINNSDDKSSYLALREMAIILTNEDPEIRTYATSALSTIKNPNILNILIELSKDKNYLNRYAAVKILSNYPVSKSINILNEIISYDNSTLVKNEAKISLAKIKAQNNN